MADDSDSPIVVAIVSDAHINSTVGLCPPAVNLDDGGTYRGGKHQRVVWAAWKEFWQIVDEKADDLDARVYAVHNGDLNDYNTHDKSQLVTQMRADVVKMTVEALDPMLGVADRVFIVRGTEAHTGKKASLEEEVAKDIEAVKDEQAGTWSWYWLKLEACGVIFDIAHHPQTHSRRPWTMDAAAVRHGRIVREEYLDRGEKPPDVAVRSHIHRYVPGNRRLKPFFVFTPPWQLNTAFSHRLGATAINKIGGLVFVCQDGEFIFEPELWGPKGFERKPWSES